MVIVGIMKKRNNDIPLSARFAFSLRAETITRGTIINADAPPSFFRLAFIGEREKKEKKSTHPEYGRESVSWADNWPAGYILGCLRTAVYLKAVFY